MPPTFRGRAARVSAPVSGLPVSGPLNHRALVNPGARLLRSCPFSAPPTTRAVARWAPLSGALDGVVPPGAAPAAPVGPRSLGGLGRRAVPASGAV
ncbi:hypothetical protein NDU88_005444 [Pleurodeles waltl]|uniref:Uncharacterized protein n=1 Tax=Pleurodeles waltl TaxID=8319 RepID=A0AAV7NRI5_PLEWA|nr:hypothetical protein NDU88_005444 [Pleurodeles waltl]